jgi:hypothetical protein
MSLVKRVYLVPGEDDELGQEVLVLGEDDEVGQDGLSSTWRR